MSSLSLSLPNNLCIYPPTSTEMDSDLSDEGYCSPTSLSISHIIKSVPRCQFPIRVSDGGPPPFDLRAQNRVMRWRCRPYSLDSEPVWIVEPDLGLIKDVARTHLERCGFSSKDITVEFFAEGGYHKLYAINTTSIQTGLPAQCIFRVFMPERPWYKIESDVATTEWVRHTTNIPVPVIYAYDSSTDNELGLEWMMLERTPGASLEDVWKDLSHDTQTSLTKQLAQWFHQLSLNTFDMIGSLYMQLTESAMEFYVGPTIDYNMYQGKRLAYNTHRGPFDCLEDYYDSILDAQQQEISDPVYQGGSASWDVGDQEPDHDAGGDGTLRELFEQDPDHKLYGRYGERIGFTEHQLQQVPKAIKALRDNLPALVEEPDTHTVSTMLSHPDLSFSNILVDPFGKVNAVIDWEGVMLHPPCLMSQYPLCLKSPERDYDCIMRSLEHDPNREEMLRINIDAMILTRSRKVFRAELEELNSPYLRVFEEQSEFQDELYDMVWNRTVNQTLVAQWVEVQLAPTDDESDYGSDDKSNDGIDGVFWVPMTHCEKEVELKAANVEEIEMPKVEEIDVAKGEEIDLMELGTEEEDEQGDLMELDIEGDDNKLAIEMAKVAWDKPKISTRLHLSLGQFWLSLVELLLLWSG